MRLLLVRHGETVDNVAGVYAGVTDSALTCHGYLQAERLGAHLSKKGFRSVEIFCSDLKRAYLTAEAIRQFQDPQPLPPTKLELIREQNFGSFEGKKSIRQDPNVVGREDIVSEVESKKSLESRANAFINDHLLKLFYQTADEHTVAVISHGIFLKYLWKSLLCRFPSACVSLVQKSGAPRAPSIKNLGLWFNTAYMELDIKQRPISLAATPQNSVPCEFTSNNPHNHETSSGKQSSIPVTIDSKLVQGPTGLKLNLYILEINFCEHLRGLKKSRGGTSNLPYNPAQKNIFKFFNQRKSAGLG